MAVEAVKKGAGECLVTAVYAPNVAEPLDVHVEVSGGDVRVPIGNLALSVTVAIGTHRPPGARVPLDWREGDSGRAQERLTAKVAPRGQSQVGAVATVSQRRDWRPQTTA